MSRYRSLWQGLGQTDHGNAQLKQTRSDVPAANRTITTHVLRSSNSQEKLRPLEIIPHSLFSVPHSAFVPVSPPPVTRLPTAVSALVGAHRVAPTSEERGMENGEPGMRNDQKAGRGLSADRDIPHSTFTFHIPHSNPPPEARGA
jgi:hypothetical protein